MPKSDRPKVTQLRKVMEVSARDFAALMGCSIDTVKSLESGRLALSQKLAKTINYRTGVSLSWLLGDSSAGPPVDDDGKEMTMVSIGQQMMSLRSKYDFVSKELLTNWLKWILTETEDEPYFGIISAAVFNLLSKLEMQFLKTAFLKRKGVLRRDYEKQQRLRAKAAESKPKRP
jgi:transcriptional regulator with XRE-family HTH domain